MALGECVAENVPTLCNVLPQSRAYQVPKSLRPPTETPVLSLTNGIAGEIKLLIDQTEPYFLRGETGFLKECTNMITAFILCAERFQRQLKKFREANEEGVSKDITPFMIISLLQEKINKLNLFGEETNVYECFIRDRVNDVLVNRVKYKKGKQKATRALTTYYLSKSDPNEREFFDLWFRSFRQEVIEIKNYLATHFIEGENYDKIIEYLEAKIVQTLNILEKIECIIRGTPVTLQ